MPHFLFSLIEKLQIISIYREIEKQSSITFNLVNVQLQDLYHKLPVKLAITQSKIEK